MAVLELDLDVCTAFLFIMAWRQELFSWVVSCMIATSGLDVTSQWKTAESNLLTVFSILSSDLCVTLFGFCLWCLWAIGEYVNSMSVTFWDEENEGKYFHDRNLSDNKTLGKVIISYHATSSLLPSSCSVSARLASTPLPHDRKNLSLPLAQHNGVLKRLQMSAWEINLHTTTLRFSSQHMHRATIANYWREASLITYQVTRPEQDTMLPCATPDKAWSGKGRGWVV